MEKLYERRRGGVDSLFTISEVRVRKDIRGGV